MSTGGQGTEGQEDERTAKQEDKRKGAQKVRRT